MMDLYLQMGAALALVSGLILGIGWLARKKQQKSGLMQIMGYQSLGPKKGMAMVRIGREVILVGVTANDVKLLKTIDRPDAGGEQPVSFDQAVAAAVETQEHTPAAGAGKTGRAPARTGTVIVADAADKLSRLRAIKDALVCH